MARQSALEVRLSIDLAADVTADHPAETGAQEFQFAPGPPELVGMGAASNHDRRPLGHATVTLAQLDAVRAKVRRREPGKPSHLTLIDHGLVPRSRGALLSRKQLPSLRKV